MCYTCNFTICKHFLWPGEIVDERCPQCKAVDWYKEAPRYKRVDKCDCYVQSCDNCGQLLCSCTIDSVLGQCPKCAEFDKWVIITLDFFFFSVKLSDKFTGSTVRTLIGTVNLNLHSWVTQSNLGEQQPALRMTTKTS